MTLTQRPLIGYSVAMPDTHPEIVRCPPPQIAEAAALVLSDLPPSARPDVAPELFDHSNSDAAADEALYVLVVDGVVCGAAWGQRQPGNTAILWPPRFKTGGDTAAALPLVEGVAHDLDALGIGMAQVLLSEDDTSTATAIRSAGFRHLADLLYLTCEAISFPDAQPDAAPLEFEPYQEHQRGRLMDVVERTYEGTQDCVALGGERQTDDVIDGYQATGEFRPDHWLFARADGQDVGVLLLADHPSAGHLELLYMGLVPEFRGQGWGVRIARHAQWVARCAGMERIVLAVDAVNSPAVAMYEEADFVAWDRRAVYMRFPAGAE